MFQDKHSIRQFMVMKPAWTRDLKECYALRRRESLNVKPQEKYIKNK